MEEGGGDASEASQAGSAGHSGGKKRTPQWKRASSDDELKRRHRQSMKRRRDSWSPRRKSIELEGNAQRLRDTRAALSPEQRLARNEQAALRRQQIRMQCTVPSQDPMPAEGAAAADVGEDGDVSAMVAAGVDDGDEDGVDGDGDGGLGTTGRSRSPAAAPAPAALRRPRPDDDDEVEPGPKRVRCEVRALCCLK